MMTRMNFGLLGIAGMLATVAVPPVHAQARASGTQTPAFHGDSRWLPWIGCWEMATEGDAPDSERVLVCFRPLGTGESVGILTYEQGQVISEEELHPNGVPAAVEEGGCAGERTAAWSADGARVFLSSDLRCGDALGRSTRGVLAILPTGKGWIEIQSARAGAGSPVLGIRTFVRAPAEALAEAGTSDPSEGLDLAVVTARAWAGETLTSNALVEVVERAGPEVASALIVERGQGFGLSAELLRSLSTRGVPGDVLDVMVAVSHPERFQIGGTGDIAPELRPVPSSVATDERASAPWPNRGRAYRGYSPWRFGYFDPFWSDPFYYDPYSYGYRPYGYRPFGAPYYEYPRVIIVTPLTVEDRGSFLDRDRGLVNRQGGSSQGGASGNVAPSSGGGTARVSPPSSGNGAGTTPKEDSNAAGSSDRVRRAVPRSGDGENR